MNKKEIRRKMLSLMGISNAWEKDENIRKQVQALGSELIGGKYSTRKPTPLQRQIIKRLEAGKYVSQIVYELKCSEIYVYDIKTRWESGEWRWMFKDS